MTPAAASRGWGRAWASLVFAASPSGSAGQPIGARRVEPVVGDTGPLAVSTRVPPAELRRPLGFDTVYELSIADAFGGGRVFLRISGAVTAVFPRSSYRPSPGGAYAEIPAGTRFYIGSLPEELQPVPAAAASSAFSNDLAADFRVQNSEKPGADQRPAHDVDPRIASVWTNEGYRQARVGQLLRQARAARAGVGP